MKSKTSQLLYAYWNDVRHNRLAPRRFEIEPARIAPILSETFILERLDDDTHRFRIAGTRICEEFDFDFRGTNFLDSWTTEDRITVSRILSTITRQGGVGILTFDMKIPTEGIVLYECILLPLIHTRDSIDRLLGGLARLDEPAARADERLAVRRLKASQVIWPDGRPNALLANRDSLPTLMPHVRNARIVRINRRQFRIYDGGLSKSEGADN